MAGPITFLTSRRPEAFKTPPANGRLGGTLNLQLHDRGSNRTQPLPVPRYSYFSAQDIAALQAGVVRKMCPAAGAHDAETTKLVHVDLADPDLPWRYTPEAIDPNLKHRPWLVLLVGKAGDFEVKNGIVSKGIPAITQKHPLAESALWANIQQDAGGGEISRIVSPYVDQPVAPGQPAGALGQLSPFQRYVAALVPAFNANGDAWKVDGTLNGDKLPVLHSWEFTTGEPGDFETIVAKLRVPTRIRSARSPSIIATALKPSNCGGQSPN